MTARGMAETGQLICDLKLGYSCNNDCLHCVIAGNRDALLARSMAIDLTTEQAMNLLREYHRQGAARVVLTGGEPTIREDFVDLVRQAQSWGFAVGIQTNGRALACEALCDAIRGFDRLCFTIPLHGDSADFHDAVTQRQGSFEQTLAGIRNLARRGCRVEGKVVMSRGNLSRLGGMLKIYAESGVKRVNFAYPHALGNARKNRHLLLPRYTELGGCLEALIGAAQEFEVAIDFEAVPFCVIPAFPELVGELHELRGSEKRFTPVHDKTRDWNHARRAIKAKGPGCSRCVYDMICEGSWSEYLAWFGDVDLKPVEQDSPGVQKALEMIVRLCRKGSVPCG